MHNFQTFLKSVRDSRQLKRETIADAINLSVETIQLIEEAGNDSLLLNSSSVLKNQIRRYCEYLEVPEKKIVSILNKIDILYYKKSRYGKLKFFDYINRLTILVIAIVIIILVTQHIRENIDDTITPENSKTAIIYTPINYDIDNSKQQQPSLPSNTSNAKTTDNINTTDNTNTNKVTQLPAATDISAVAPKTLVAHPPTTANINNVVIDDETTPQQSE